ncbi:hypothetical protein QBC37DRAFT_444935 [Rhypophila decipiens]|uniref:NAD-dependent epimerase/dehydratase domain-containing protein n=1 Tax=Rhypophila decipiens TaxID=261697 RepID=A0AAN7B1Q5_9PEZI|nr:hypothetical protein QBC37DRAFT_444935 [Rhypophila decipiens]
MASKLPLLTTGRTGSTGSVGGSVATEIVKAGYKIRALVRNDEKGRYLRETLTNSHGADAVELSHTASLTDREAIESAMQGCAGVVHVASDISTRNDPEEVIAPTVSAVKVLLEAACKTPSVKRFVFTSSLATLPSAREEVDITSSSWAPDSVIESAWAIQDSGLPEEQKGLVVYAASKILAERACWDFMRERAPHFVLNTVVPFTNIGAFVHPKLVSSFNGLVLGVWLGDAQASTFFKKVMQGAGVSHLINLEDCGLLHLAALTLDDVRGERILAAADAFKFNDILDVMNKLDPARMLPESLEHEPGVKASIDKARCKELLARLGKAEPTGLEESIKQAITSGTGVIYSS